MKDYFLIRYLFNTFIILFKFFNFIFQGLSSIILFHKKGLTTKFLMTRPINRWLCTSNEENVYFVGTSNFSFILQNQPNYYLSSCAFPKFVLNNFKKFWTFSCLERDAYKVLIERKMKILLNIWILIPRLHPPLFTFPFTANLILISPTGACRCILSNWGKC